MNSIAFYHGPVFPDLIAYSHEFEIALEVYNVGFYGHAMRNMILKLLDLFLT